MEFVAKESTDDYLKIAHSLAQEFAKTAIERDKQGGTAKAERDMLRESGLLALIIPKSLGGHGEDWKTVLQLTRELAKVDGSLAYLFAYHFLCLTSVNLYGSPQQKEIFYRETAEHHYFWGNAINPRDQNLIAKKDGEHWRVSGRKSFCSGAKDSDGLLISATNPHSERPIIAVIPSKHSGIHIKDDWNSFGQKQTDSGTVLFDNVLIEKEEVLDFYDQNREGLFPTIRTHTAQTILIHILLGIAEGAFEEVKEYTKNSSPPWLTSHEDQAKNGPYTIGHYGVYSFN